MAGKPGVYIHTDNFGSDARNSAQDNGMPSCRMVAVPADRYYRYRLSEKEVMPIAESVIDQIVEALTKPVAPEEANPPAADVDQQNNIITAKAESFSAAAEEINRIFLEKHWSDGLPIVPPTRDLVDQMLKGTSRSADEVIGKVSPKNGIATVEKIAINSVMAGAKPEYLPVIVAAMEGLVDDNFDLTHLQASTGSFLPAIIVAGPIAKELNFNSGIGMLGHGWRANSTVGRAIRLALLNLGHTWPAENDMALTGRPSSHTFYTFANDDDRDPWEPDHVNRGFLPGDNTVTVSTVGGQFRALGGGAVAFWTAQGVLDNIVANVGGPSRYLNCMKYIIVFHPDCAAELAKMGHTRASVQEWIFEQTRVPVSRLNAGMIQYFKRMVEDGRIRPEHVDVFKQALEKGGKLPVVQGPEDFHVYVAGGSPGYSLFLSYPGLNYGHEVRKITGATLTENGR